MIFTHIPKCAGTSFIRLLRRWFREGYCHVHQDESTDRPLGRADTKDDTGEWNEYVRVIHSHFDAGRGYGLPNHYPEIQQYFALMRDPFDVLVSMYFFAKGRSQRGEFKYRGKTVDIREHFPDVSAYVAADQAWLENHLPTDMTEDNCEEYVASRFVYLGNFENLQESIDHLAFVLGKRRQILDRKNQANYDEELPESLRELIYERYPRARRFHEVSQSTYRVPGFDSASIEPAINAASGQKATSDGPQGFKRWLARWKRRSVRD